MMSVRKWEIAGRIQRESLNALKLLTVRSICPPFSKNLGQSLSKEAELLHPSAIKANGLKAHLQEALFSTPTS